MNVYHYGMDLRILSFYGEKKLFFLPVRYAICTVVMHGEFGLKQTMIAIVQIIDAFRTYSQIAHSTLQILRVETLLQHVPNATNFELYE